MMTRRVFGRLLSLGGLFVFKKKTNASHLPNPTISQFTLGNEEDESGLLFRVHAEGRVFEIYVNGRVRGFEGESVGVDNRFMRQAEIWRTINSEDPFVDGIRKFKRQNENTFDFEKRIRLASKVMKRELE